MELINMYAMPIMLVIFVIYLMISQLMKAKRFKEQSEALYDELKKGDYIKTYAGMYGEIVKIEILDLETGQRERVVTLKLDDTSTIRIDINGIFAVIPELKPKKKRATKKA
jgi:preprotein translocase YajC subunit